MVLTNAAQYIQTLATSPLPPLLSPSPGFTPAAQIVHAIIQSNIAVPPHMSHDTFRSFLQSSLQECNGSQSNTSLHELYIYLLFLQILRDLIGHLALDDQSPYLSALDDTQAHITHSLTPQTPQQDFSFHHTLPNSDHWFPTNAPSRTRTWIVWPDVHSSTPKQYTTEGWSEMTSISQDFEQHHFRNNEDPASPQHPLWQTDFAKQQGRPYVSGHPSGLSPSLPHNTPSQQGKPTYFTLFLSHSTASPCPKSGKQPGLRDSPPLHGNKVMMPLDVCSRMQPLASLIFGDT